MSPPPAVAAASADLSLQLLRAPAAPATLRQAEPKPAVVAAPVVKAKRDERVFVGIGLILLSTVFFSIADIAAKMVVATMPAMEVVWIRYMVFLAIVLPLTAMTSGRSAFKSENTGLQVLRGLGMVGSSMFFIAGLRHLSVADSTAANFVAPLFITALSVLILREKVGVRRWMATGVGLIGVLIVVRPGPDILQSAILFPIAGAFAWACAALVTRRMAGTDRPETTLVYSALVGVAVLSAVMPFIWETPTEAELMLALVVGLLSTVGHWLLVLGYRHATASLLAPFSYIQLLWAIGLGYIVLGTLPTIWTVVGGSIIAASGLYIAHRERVRSRAAA